VVWLDAGKEGFRVRGRTLDRATGKWSDIVTIGEAQDNHGGPGMTVDSKGYLHILYYPHHGMFRYRRTVRPNDISEWTPETKFGEELSFPTLICASDDTLFLSARRGNLNDKGQHSADSRVEQELWTKAPGGEWTRKSTILRSRHPDYAQFATTMAWGPDGKTIHVSTRVAEGNSMKITKPIRTVAYMVSHDLGETWTRADGTPIALPANVDTLDTLANDGGPTGPVLDSGPLAVSKDGVPYLVYSANLPGVSRFYLASPAPGLGWTRRDLTPYLPEAVRGWDINMAMGGGITFSESGRATIVVAVLNPPKEERSLLKYWGHRSCEVVRLWSDDGMKTFQSEVLGTIDPNRAHWLPNIERATGHNRVPDPAGVIFTDGPSGGGLKDLELHNGVRWQPSN
jgi:hypothetical protein